MGAAEVRPRGRAALGAFPFFEERRGDVPPRRVFIIIWVLVPMLEGGETRPLAKCWRKVVESSEEDGKSGRQASAQGTGDLSKQERHLFLCAYCALNKSYLSARSRVWML